MKVFDSIISSVAHPMGLFSINRVMPQREITPVGAFVFLDHFDINATPEQMPTPDGSLAHPHRGIATLTYLINGEVTHLDSYGQMGSVSAGGVQWMKAGKGIIHDEWAKPVNNKFTGLQFWINLEAKGKADKPEYKAINNAQLPEIKIGKLASRLKVIVGEFNGVHSAIPSESEQVLLHLSLKAGEELNLPLNKNYDYAVFLASGRADFGSEYLNELQQGFVKPETTSISISAREKSELFVYGGVKYEEPIVSGGPFIMNSERDLMAAYKDYQLGKYREIDYSLIQ